MNEEKDQREELSSKADAAFRLAAKKVIERARRTGTPVVVWKGGRVKEMLGDQFEITTTAMELRELTD